MINNYKEVFSFTDDSKSKKEGKDQELIQVSLQIFYQYGYSVILFCLFYSRIQAAFQSKKGLYFPRGFYWDLPVYSQIQKAQAVSQKKAIKSLVL